MIEALKLYIVGDPSCAVIESRNRKRKIENTWNIERSPLMFRGRRNKI